ncbi:nucleoside deaminase [Anthocerotibacter panamensis]|uniref:nucleoside deaminase n=1 Tax=Anthocerotibacter panamensis TaxID=2857077 RepID=UPI001C407AA7|nr:nucleoside deaminase [Anthocerotibacter panamensis]
MSIEAPTLRDIAMVKLALEEARQALAHGKAGVGAVLVLGEEILARGHNMSVETGDQTAHAEMVVLQMAARRLAQLTDAQKAQLAIYTSLEPCLMCFSALAHTGVKRIAYSALIEDADEESMVVRGLTSDQINDHLMSGPAVLIPGVCREAGQEIMALMGKGGDGLKG